MTKNEFIAIQTALKDGYGAMLAITGPHSQALTRNLMRSHISTCKAVADVLGKTNPKFKLDAFMLGCGCIPYAAM